MAHAPSRFFSQQPGGRDGVRPVVQSVPGQRDLAAFARNLTREQMKALGFPRDWNRRIHRYIPPSESTFARMLRHLDNAALQRALQRWLDHLLGKRNPVGDQVSVDGKELLNSQGVKVASAYSVTHGRWLGSEVVAEGSNEIPAVRSVLRRVDLDGSLVTSTISCPPKTTKRR